MNYLLKGNALILFFSIVFSFVASVILHFSDFKMNGPLSFYRIFIVITFNVIAMWTLLSYNSMEKRLGVALFISITLPLYQTLFLFDTEGTLLYRVFPAIIISIGLILCSKSISKEEVIIALVTMLLLLIGNNISGISKFDSIGYLFVSCVLPLTLYLAMKQANVLKLDSVFNFSIMILLLGTAITIPIEMSLRNSTASLGLQSGNLYMIVGVAFLSLPIVFNNYRNSQSQTLFAFIVFLLIIAFSYSRGALTLSVFIFTSLIYSFVSQGKAKVVLALVLAVSIFLLVFWEELLEIIWFWGLKFNIASNLSNTLEYSFENSFQLSGRESIWSLTMSYLSDNTSSIFFGVGVGNFYEMISSISNLGYKSAHNMFLTTLLERGIFVTLILYSLMFYSFYRVFVHHRTIGNLTGVTLLSFFSFILFSHITGVEFFQVTNSLAHSTITILIVYSLQRYKNV